MIYFSGSQIISYCDFLPTKQIYHKEHGNTAYVILDMVFLYLIIFNESHFIEAVSVSQLLRFTNYRILFFDFI